MTTNTGRTPRVKASSNGLYKRGSTNEKSNWKVKLWVLKWITSYVFGEGKPSPNLLQIRSLEMLFISNDIPSFSHEGRDKSIHYSIVLSHIYLILYPQIDLNIPNSNLNIYTQILIQTYALSGANISNDPTFRAITDLQLTT